MSDLDQAVDTAIDKFVGALDRELQKLLPTTLAEVTDTLRRRAGTFAEVWVDAVEESEQELGNYPACGA